MASSTMSWNVRSSSLGGGIMVLLVALRATVLFFRAQVEREHEVAPVVLAADHVVDADVEPVGLVGVLASSGHDLRDPRLELEDRFAAVDLGARRRHLVVGGEHEIVDPAAEIRATDPLARRGAEDDEDRL